MVQDAAFLILHGKRLIPDGRSCPRTDAYRPQQYRILSLAVQPPLHVLVYRKENVEGDTCEKRCAEAEGSVHEQENRRKEKNTRGAGQGQKCKHCKRG